MSRGRKSGNHGAWVLSASTPPTWTMMDVEVCRPAIQVDIRRHLAQAEAEGCEDPLDVALQRWREEIGAADKPKRSMFQKRMVGNDQYVGEAAW